jgi:hypothetical protein
VLLPLLGVYVLSNWIGVTLSLSLFSGASLVQLLRTRTKTYRKGRGINHTNLIALIPNGIHEIEESETLLTTHVFHGVQFDELTCTEWDI